MALSRSEITKRYRERRLAEIEQMPKKLCACGCGELMSPVNIQGKTTDYIKGHKQRGTKRSAPAWNRLGDKPLTGAERQKRAVEKKRAAIALMDKIPCSCGCGTLIAPITTEFKPAQYALGHNPGGEATRFTKGQTPHNKGKPYPVATRTHKGKPKSKESMEKRTVTRLAKNGGVYQIKSGWTHTPKTIQNMTVAVRKRDLKGANNPFYGKQHSDDSRQRMGAEGEKHPNWKGGVSTLPYGSGFTRKYKRLIRQRDNYICQSCGLTQAEHWRTLEIHHIDHNKMNNDPTNLVTVCGSCNVWYSYHRDEPFFVMGRDRS